MKIDCTLRDEDKNTFLHMLYLDSNRKINRDIVASDLLKKGIDIDAVNVYGETALHICCQKGMDPTFLIRSLANCNIADNMGNLPLHSYLQSGNVKGDILEALCKMTKDHSTRDDEGDNPLETAIKCDCPDWVKFTLLSYRMSSWMI